MDKIRVLVCDDMVYMCMFFSSLINSSKSCECVGMAHNESETLALTKELKPDVILLDIQMDSMNSGIELIPQILEISPESKVIAISIHDDSDKMFKAIQAGAINYLLKNQNPENIIESIERTYSGKSELSLEIGKKILERCVEIEERQKSILYTINKMMSLSSRELEVLRAICDGYTYEEIAEKIFIEDVTVRTTVSRILKKMKYSRMSTLVEHLNEMKIFQLFKDNQN